MDYPTYQRNVLARASSDWHVDAIDLTDLKQVLAEFIIWGNRLDRVKKALFYGKPFEFYVGGGVEGCQRPVPDCDPNTQQLLHALIGAATEGVELMEAFAGAVIDNVPLDACNLQEEFGDLEWYRALGLSALSQTHEANFRLNDSKLEARYGSTFSQDAALTRDLAAERTILEGGSDAE